MEDALYHLEQLEKQVSHLRSTIQQDTKRLERLKSQLALTYSQLSIYKEEVFRLKNALNDCISDFTAETCAELRGIKAPISSLCEVCDKVLLLLNINDRSWKSFRSLTKHFAAFRNLLITSQGESIEDCIINEVLPLWKGQKHYRVKLERCYGGNLLLDWIGYVVELNLKKEIIRSSQKRVPELKKMIKLQNKSLSALIDENEKIENIVKQAKNGMDHDFEFEDCSEIGFKTVSYKNTENDERFLFNSTVHRGTASGGIMQKTSRGLTKKTENVSVFPNFSSDSLYGETPVYKQTEIDEQIIYEGRNEVIGCCRMNFFCF